MHIDIDIDFRHLPLVMRDLIIYAMIQIARDVSVTDSSQSSDGVLLLLSVRLHSQLLVIFPFLSLRFIYVKFVTKMKSTPFAVWRNLGQQRMQYLAGGLVEGIYLAVERNAYKKNALAAKATFTKTNTVFASCKCCIGSLYKGLHSL